MCAEHLDRKTSCWVEKSCDQRFWGEGARGWEGWGDGCRGSVVLLGGMREVTSMLLLDRVTVRGREEIRLP